MIRAVGFSRLRKAGCLDDNKMGGWQPIKGVLLVFLVLGTLGLAFFFWKYDQVFPAASLDLKLSRQEITARAREFSASMGYDTRGCVESTTFQERSESRDKPGAATFLEHEYTMSEANALMRSEVCQFFWYTRFCKTHQEEEFQVWLRPDGRLAAINHEIEKERALPSSTEQEAMRMALQFVRQRAGYSLYSDLPPEKPPVLTEGVKLIRHGSTKQQRRVDYYFTWEDQKTDYKGAYMRTSVDVSGNQITAYDRDLHVPEAFERRYASMRSYNDLFKSISSVLFCVIAAGMVFAFVWALSTRRIRWKLAILAGVASFAISFLDYWNNWQGVLQAYSTTESMQGYVTSRLVTSLLGALVGALAAVMLVGGMDAVYRQQFPDKIAPEHLFSWKMLANRSLLISIIAGILVLGIHLGYVSAYYLLGQKLGFWSPLELRDVGTISSILPAFSSFSVGVNASVSEELLYRVLCLVLARKLCKNFWIANLIQAAGWAFMHSDYPQEPAYARGVELTLVGLFYGWLFKRFGILTCIIAHFMYDAFLGVTPLLFARSAFMYMQGVLAASPPVLALALGFASRRAQAVEPPDRDLLNERLVTVLPASASLAEPQAEKPPDCVALSAKTKTVLVVLLLVSMLPIFFLHPRRVGGWAKISVRQAEIEKIASKFLKERGVQEGDWRVSSTLSANGDFSEVQYGFEKLGFRKTEQLIRRGRLQMLWWVRFYKPQQKREYDVAVSSEGRPVALKVIDEENAPGQTIGQNDAHRITEEFLKSYRPEFSPLQFDAAEEQKRKNRSDFTVSYVVPELKMGDARFKVYIDTVGGLVSFPQVVWDIPDSWYYERNKVTVKDHIARGVSQVVFVGILAFAVIYAVGVFRAAAVRWRPVLIVALAAGSLSMFNQGNEFVSKLAGYDTNVPIASALTEMVVRSIISAIIAAAVNAGLFALAQGAWRVSLAGGSAGAMLIDLFRPSPQRRKQVAAVWSDGVLSAYSFVLVINAIGIVNTFCEGKFSPEVVLLSLYSLTSLSLYSFPALAQITDAVFNGFATLMAMPVVAGFYCKYVKTGKRLLIFSFLAIGIIHATTRYWQDYVREVFFYGIGMLFCFWWVRYCARRNPVAYFVAGALNTVLFTIYYMIKYSTIYTLEWIILSAFCLLPLLMPLWLKAAAPAEKAEA
jgi:hypothetical protein